MIDLSPQPPQNGEADTGGTRAGVRSARLELAFSFWVETACGRGPAWGFDKEPRDRARVLRSYMRRAASAGIGIGEQAEHPERSRLGGGVFAVARDDV